LDKEVVTFNLHESRAHRSCGRPADYSARGHIELAPMAGTCHRCTIQFAARKRTPPMCACVIEGMQMSTGSPNTHRGSLDLEDAHFAFGNIICTTYFYQHCLPSYSFLQSALRCRGPRLRLNHHDAEKSRYKDFRYSTRSFFS